MGNCENDTIKITGADIVTMKTLPSNLCGMLSGQHIYLSVKDVSSVQITIELKTISTQKWSLKFIQLDSRVDYLAPLGCLQYHTSEVGFLMSFNSAGSSPELLNDHMYSICFEQINPRGDQYCDIALEPSLFDLAGSAGSCADSLAFGFNVVCGTSLGFNTCNYLLQFL